MTSRRKWLSAAVRIRVMKRDRFRCTYCGVAGTDAELEVDHIIAIANGGSHHMSNLTTACRKCNQDKGASSAPPKRTSSEAISPVGMYLHTFDENGVMNMQGHIIRVDGDTFLVQLFSWLTGFPTDVVPMPRAEVYGRCKLYATAALWKDAADQIMRREAAMEARQAV